MNTETKTKPIEVLQVSPSGTSRKGRLSLNNVRAAVHYGTHSFIAENEGIKERIEAPIVHVHFNGDQVFILALTETLKTALTEQGFLP